MMNNSYSIRYPVFLLILNFTAYRNKRGMIQSIIHRQDTIVQGEDHSHLRPPKKKNRSFSETNCRS